jgi:iron complex outermembrane receptor protein
MKKLIFSILLIVLLCPAIQSQNYELKVTVTTHDKEPLVGATVYFESLDLGAIANFEGIALFNDLPEGAHELTVSYLGFETQSRSVTIPEDQVIVFLLEESGHHLEEVILQSTRSSRTIKKIPTRIEFIGGEELFEKNMMNATNISMVLRESTGIQMQQTSLSSGNSNIRIQGLDGRYTQLLKDGFPLYGGFSSGLSIMQIPPLDLKQFEIIKGSSSTLYGGGAIAGLVDLVSKTPEDEPALDVMYTQTHAWGSTANIFYSKRNEKFGVSLYGSGHIQKVYDAEDDGFSNLPKTKTISFNPKFYYYPSEKTRVWLGLNGTYDNRIGGDIMAIEDGISNEHIYTEENISKRLSSQIVYKTNFGLGRSFEFKNSVSLFDRELQVPNIYFKGHQTNTFTEASYNWNGNKGDWIIGTNLYTIHFNEDEDMTLQRDQDDLTFGVFANNIFDISENWILETGFRADLAKDWGFFPLPRISVLYKDEKGFSSRLGGGLGYKIPDIFTEEAEFIHFENVLPIDKDQLEVERSMGFNMDFNYETQLFGSIGFSINQLFYLTAIKEGLLLNSNEAQLFEFENAPDDIVSKGAETNIKFSYHDFKWFLNYAYIDTRLKYLPGSPQKPLTAMHNGGSVVMYETSIWRLGFETYYTGEQLLSNGNSTNDYITMGFLAMRNFKWGALFANFENFTDRRQSRYSPLVLPPADDPTFPEIYAPTDGFIFSLGVIIKPFGNESDHH